MIYPITLYWVISTKMLWSDIYGFLNFRFERLCSNLTYFISCCITSFYSEPADCFYLYDVEKLTISLYIHSCNAKLYNVFSYCNAQFYIGVAKKSKIPNENYPIGTFKYCWVSFMKAKFFILNKIGFSLKPGFPLVFSLNWRWLDLKNVRKAIEHIF
jgi:hypothetical protein